jgi:hypothetical protein
MTSSMTTLSCNNIFVVSYQEGKKIKLSVCVSVCVCVCVCKWNSYIDILCVYTILRIFINMDTINGWTSLMDGINGRH